LALLGNSITLLRKFDLADALNFKHFLNTLFTHLTLRWAFLAPRSTASAFLSALILLAPLPVNAFGRCQVDPAEPVMSGHFSLPGAALAYVSPDSVIQAPPAAEVSDTAKLEELNRQILLQEVLLEKHAINFRHYNNFQGRWKGWRYFLTQETNNVTTAGGLIFQLAERYRVFNIPYTLQAVKVTTTNDKTKKKTTVTKIAPVLQRTKRAKLEGGFYPQLVGQALAGAGSGLEMGLNHYHQWQANKLGFGCKESIKQVKAYRDEIDRLLKERHAIIDRGSLTAGDLAVARAEESVLQDTTVLSLREYEDVHVNARRFRVLQDALYVFDMSRNSTGAAGNIVAICGQHEGSGYLGGPANVLTTISGTFGVLTPVASRLYARLIGDRHRAYVRREIGNFHDCQITDYDMDRKNLQMVLDAKASRGEVVSEKATALLASYEAAAVERSAQYHLSQRDLRAGVRAAQENITVGCVNGLTKVCIGITGVIGGYGFTTSNHRTNDILIPGTITYIAGTWLSAGENIRLRVIDEINRHRLGERGLLPSQVQASRMKTLNEVESDLMAAK
jgi:hypothetical protein